MMLDPQTAFAIYRLPNTTHIEIVTGKATAITNIEQVLSNRSGYILSPFNKSISYSPYLIEGQSNKINKEELHSVISALQLLAKPEAITSTERAAYNTQIAQIKEAISKGNVSKAILSRIQLIPHDKTQLTDQFEALCRRYPHVMISLVHIPDVCTWLTATPEILINITNGTLTTVSLAGTQLDTGIPITEVTWGAKELDEQQIVSDYISNLLKQHLGGQASIDGPSTISTGQVLHLKTLFSAKVDDKTNVTSFLNAMHPTPAVCGKPKQAAMDLINQVERHNRAYYAGYLGPVNMNTSTQLFVNLRCMQLFQGEAALYLGGGITAGSIADLEWRETEIKADTLLKVLNNKP